MKYINILLISLSILCGDDKYLGSETTLNNAVLPILDINIDEYTQIYEDTIYNFKKLQDWKLRKLFKDINIEVDIDFNNFNEEAELQKFTKFNFKKIKLLFKEEPNKIILIGLFLKDNEEFYRPKIFNIKKIYYRLPKKMRNTEEYVILKSSKDKKNILRELEDLISQKLMIMIKKENMDIESKVNIFKELKIYFELMKNDRYDYSKVYQNAKGVKIEIIYTKGDFLVDSVICSIQENSSLVNRTTLGISIELGKDFELKRYKDNLFKLDKNKDQLTSLYEINKKYQETKLEHIKIKQGLIIKLASYGVFGEPKNYVNIDEQDRLKTIGDSNKLEIKLDKLKEEISKDLLLTNRNIKNSTDLNQILIRKKEIEEEIIKLNELLGKKVGVLSSLFNRKTIEAEKEKLKNDKANLLNKLKELEENEDKLEQKLKQTEIKENIEDKGKIKGSIESPIFIKENEVEGAIGGASLPKENNIEKKQSETNTNTMKKMNSLINLLDITTNSKSDIPYSK